jgi:tRNA A-37 threonylcarbamoyl transferase component Bud32
VFTPKHFRDLGSEAAIDSALRRLRADGTVRRLARGLYDYPVTDPVLGAVAPSADAIARALVVRDAIRLQPSGAYAANQLGLSEQVPSRVVKFGKREIILQHTTPRNMATAGRKSGTIIQALRHLGQSQVDDGVLAKLRRQITDADRASLRKDLIHAPAWIVDLLRPLLDGASLKP